MQWERSSRKKTKRERSTHALSLAASSSPRNRTTRSTIKKCWSSSKPWRIGDTIWKVQVTRPQCIQTIRTCSGLQKLNCTTVARHGGQKNYLGSTLSSYFVQGKTKASRMRYQETGLLASERGR